MALSLTHRCLALSGTPKWEEKGCITRAIMETAHLGGIKMAELLSWAPQTGAESKWLHNPCRLRVPRRGRNQNGYACHVGHPKLERNQNGNISCAILGTPIYEGIKVAT